MIRRPPSSPLFPSPPLSRSFSPPHRHLNPRLNPQPIPRRHPAQSHTQMQCHVIAESQVCRRIDLMPPLELTERGVVLDSKRHRPADIQARPHLRLELKLVLGARQIALERGIEEQLQTPNPALENRGQLESVRALAEGWTRSLIFDAEPHIHRQPPLLRRTEP